jgi:hypothetical protein
MGPSVPCQHGRPQESESIAALELQRLCAERKATGRRVSCRQRYYDDKKFNG